MSNNPHQILEIFSYFDKKRGDVLLANQIVAIGEMRGWNIGALQLGLEDAHNRGWIEAADLGWRLTADGHKEVVSLAVRLQLV